MYIYIYIHICIASLLGVWGTPERPGAAGGPAAAAAPQVHVGSNTCWLHLVFIGVVDSCSYYIVKGSSPGISPKMSESIGRVLASRRVCWSCEGSRGESTASKKVPGERQNRQITTFICSNPEVDLQILSGGGGHGRPLVAVLLVVGTADEYWGILVHISSS